jgi:23S rRNA (adenine1618-N6)-methyltransferase
MSEIKKSTSTVKTVLHPRNKHREQYDFKALTTACPELAKHVKTNAFGTESIDFANPKAVKWLNKALLKQYYSVEFWDIPSGYLCPPIPGRADYIHHIAELLGKSNNGKIPLGKKIKCMDIGVGAGCIYPIIGAKEYGWTFIGSDIDTKALDSADRTIHDNAFLNKNITLRFQENPKDIFHGIMERTEPIDLTICNPPFYSSAEESEQSTLKKMSSLKNKKITTPVQNFGGQSNELWCDGGEVRFIRDMIRQSKQFSTNCFWFSTLVAKKDHLAPILEAIKLAGTVDVKTIQMGQGTKISRIVAWTFLNKTQQERWKETRWNAM